MRSPLSPDTGSIEGAFSDARAALRDDVSAGDPPLISRLLNERDELRAQNEILGCRCAELEKEAEDARALLRGTLARIESWILAADVAHIAQFVRAASSS